MTASLLFQAEQEASLDLACDFRVLPLRSGDGTERHISKGGSSSRTGELRKALR